MDNKKKKSVMKFEKMQGTGNDYIYINLFEEKVNNPSELSRKLSDRHFGVGSDGIVLIGPGDEGDFSMRMFNADGSESEMCGNAARCVGKYLYERGLTRMKEIDLWTRSGIKPLRLAVNPRTGEVDSVRVDMGEAVFSGDDAIRSQVAIPDMVDYPLRADDQLYLLTFVSMGNPHAVIFTHDIDQLEIEKIGPMIEFNPLFPERANVEFIEVIDEAHIKMRVWERGSGETMACGSGACAAVVAGIVTKRCGAKVSVQLKGGVLEVEWDQPGNRVFLTGDAHFVFKGVI